MKLRQALLATLLATTGFQAYATPILCPDTLATTDREFTINTAPAATCLATGTGNINGNNDSIDQLGYITIDTS